MLNTPKAGVSPCPTRKGTHPCHTPPRPPPRATAETPPAFFPETGSITYSPHWLDLKRDAGCNMDNTLIATSFRRFLSERGIARDVGNIEKLFTDFCAKVGKV